ncbi:urease subunit alpha [Helicobacter pylori]|uniref:urease subunit alpha n=1 Tax=Helicobacter pylori TaxID=210 RepID=UPI001AA2F8C5|nr:urease subunit alpha [Helicobacter pylori]UOS62284.1 urease subunit alpha [Helicobacter pylori]GHR50380.1 urease subunit alpha [Helicobacter pylori]
MKLTPKELDKLMLHYAGELAKKRKEKGIKLNYVEAVALISAHIMEEARAGKKSAAELMQEGRTLLKPDDVMDGVASMIHEVGIEAMFPDGTKLVTVHTPIEANGKLVPGELFLKNEDITINEGKKAVSVKVKNVGDRPVQIGSHFHFFEVNRCLDFDREKTFGKRLDIASGTAVRFEPGEEKSVELIDIGGNRRIFGFNALVDRQADNESKKIALHRAKERGFHGTKSDDNYVKTIKE